MAQEGAKVAHGGAKEAPSVQLIKYFPSSLLCEQPIERFLYIQPIKCSLNAQPIKCPPSCLLFVQPIKCSLPMLTAHRMLTLLPPTRTANQITILVCTDLTAIPE